MQPLNIWQLFHTYTGLYLDGKAASLACPNDGATLVVRMKPENVDTMYLFCFDCNTWTRPGLDLIRQVEAVVKEHFDVQVTL